MNTEHDKPSQKCLFPHSYKRFENTNTLRQGSKGNFESKPKIARGNPDRGICKPVSYSQLIKLGALTSVSYHTLNNTPNLSFTTHLLPVTPYTSPAGVILAIPHTNVFYTRPTADTKTRRLSLSP